MAQKLWYEPEDAGYQPGIRDPFILPFAVDLSLDFEKQEVGRLIGEHFHFHNAVGAEVWPITFAIFEKAKNGPPLFRVKVQRQLEPSFRGLLLPPTKGV